MLHTMESLLMLTSNRTVNVRRLISISAGIWLSLFATAGMAQSVFGVDRIDCPTTNSDERKDYRLRDTTRILRFKSKDTHENHVAPAMQLMREGIYSERVIGDLNFTLVRWPNHYPALQTLIKYEDAGGRTTNYLSVSCYFQRAAWYVPDDANIYVLNGVYLHRKGDYEGAKSSWKAAVSIDGESAEAHYNLGLLYVRLEDYSSAVKHAQLAYELGYPLPGLKEKLERSGHWE